MSAPENTTRRDPFVHFAGMLEAGSSDYITGMEADGQRQILASDTLPSRAPWADLEALGFTPGEPVRGDDLFRHCTLPVGWKREGSDHTMWSYIVDERGVRRVSIFYKAAFYDRKAHASINEVGSGLAYEAIYGDGDAALPAAWGVLTDEERADFREALAEYLDDAEHYPSRPADRVVRVEKLVEMTR